MEPEKEPSKKRPPWWKRLWGWTQFGKKSGWEWVQLLIVPLALVGIGFAFDIRQQGLEDRRADREQELTEQRAQDEALQAYLDQMSTLLIEKDLRSSPQQSEVRTLARARTLTVLRRLDPSRKADVTNFLMEARLIQSGEGSEGGAPTIRLDGANLSGTDLSYPHLSYVPIEGPARYEIREGGLNLDGASLSAADLSSADLRGASFRHALLLDADLRSADLKGADLSGATLIGAILSGADLSGADVSERQLRDAESLEGAIMPYGSKHD